MKTEKGQSLIGVLVAIAIFMIFSAMFAKNMVTVIQKHNEDNVQAGVLALMKAEAQYYASWSSYATGSNLHWLSDCPVPVPNPISGGPPVVIPTAQAACVSISTAYTTQGSTPWQYSFYVAATPGPDNTPGTKDDGYLISAYPLDNSSGRLIFCANDQDGLVRAQLTAFGPALNNDAECDAFPVREAGPTAPPSTTPTTSQQLTYSGAASSPVAGSSDYTGPAMPMQTMNLPSGSWHVTAVLSFMPSLTNATALPTIGCELSTASGVLDTGYVSGNVTNQQLPAPGITVTGITPGATTAVTFQCEQANQNGMIGVPVNPYPAYTVVMTADPVQASQ